MPRVTQQGSWISLQAPLYEERELLSAWTLSPVQSWEEAQGQVDVRKIEDQGPWEEVVSLQGPPGHYVETDAL